MIHTDDGRGGPPAETVRSMETINKIKDSEMKVKDLINKLLKLNPELPVFGCVDAEIHGIEVDDCLEDRVDINLVIDDNPRKPITLQHIIEYFEVDLDNCHLDQRDLCKEIHRLISNPEKEISNWETVIEEYYEERGVDAWEPKIKKGQRKCI